ncbi:LysR family transcriptional regulator [Tsukamurella soli]|uniref:LysR family transcriptional regulator n=1 Tax=Tsukamurella soli TaxID=644556 RepID=UPI00360DACFF
MELHQLRYLVAVSDHGSFTAAADALHVSQSGVSAQVGKLERELGHRLLDRPGAGSAASGPHVPGAGSAASGPHVPGAGSAASGPHVPGAGSAASGPHVPGAGSAASGPQRYRVRTVTLTPAGEALLPYARAAVRTVDDLRTAADELSGLQRGHVRLGTVIGCTIPGFLAGFAEFRAMHPGVTVEASESDSDVLAAGLAEGALDVALLAHAEPLPGGIAARTLITEPLTVVVAPTHPWADRETIDPAELADATVLTLPAGTGARAAFDATCARAGVTVVPTVQAHSPRR